MRKHAILFVMLSIFSLTSCDLLNSLNFNGPRRRSSREQESQVVDDSAPNSGRSSSSKQTTSKHVHTYDEDVLRLRDEFMRRDFMVGSVVITHYNGQHAADQFRHRLEREGIKSYIHYPIDGYPHNVELIASDEGFGKNDFVETSRPLVIVTAPGPGSGKMATCLSQLYNENKRGIRAGYAKFETFPVWNLPLKHPVNIIQETSF